jgi:hypothetical protein
MSLQLILVSCVILALAVMAFGIKLFFDKKAKLPQGSCQASLDKNKQVSCICGGEGCLTDNKYTI